MLKLIYTVFLGIIIATFIGVGVSVFYEAPEGPTEPTWWTEYQGERFEPSEEQMVQEREFQQKSDEFQQNEMADYNRNVSLITAGFAIALLSLGLIFADKLDVVADGLLLGGVFTFLYSMGRGLASDNNQFRFFIMTVGLIAAISLGYMKFVRGKLPETDQKSD